MKYSEEILVLRAKVVNKKFCSSDCPFFTEVTNSSGHACSCNLFGALEQDYVSVSLLEDDEAAEAMVTLIELPVRSEHCVAMGKRELK